MTSIQRTVFFSVAVVLAAGCRTGPRCGDLRYDPERNACACYDGSTFDPEAGVCVPDPGPDGCVPDDETCNAVDDDCDGEVDEAPILGCAVPSGALEAQCTAGACEIARCEPGHEDCDGDFTNGCEVDLASDAANCGTCGTQCAWTCEEGACDDPIDIERANSHACAVRASGQVVCWGDNSYGQLGDGTYERRLTPVAVGGLTNAVEVALGQGHSCARSSEGEVFCWGANRAGQLGNGTRTASPAAQRVAAISGARAIASGNSHSCALRSDGTVWCWGAGTEGQLGDGAAVSRDVPTQVSGLTTATRISAAYSSSCAIGSDAIAYCWGNNRVGSLGLGDMAPANTPRRVMGDLYEVTSIDIGGLHGCAATRPGALYCWGWGALGGLAPPESEEMFLLPQRVAGIADVREVVCETEATCARLGDGAVRCVGTNRHSLLGDGTVTARSTFDVDTIPSGATVVGFGGGAFGGCALTTDGPVCWGQNAFGAVGDGTTEERSRPTIVASP